MADCTESVEHIVYRTENLVNGKFYYGVHKPTDTRHSIEYTGSGLLLDKAKKKYGRKNFIRRTIMKFDTGAEAYSFEGLMVDEALVKDAMCYNLKLGGFGGWAQVNRQPRAEATMRKISQSNTGKKHTQESKDKISKGNAGKVRTQECKDHLSALKRGTPSWTKPFFANSIRYVKANDYYEATGNGRGYLESRLKNKANKNYYYE